MNRFVVINSKGGCGKTTIASNLASYYASSGIATSLFDHDPQQSSMRWLDLRSAESAPIHGVFAAKGQTTQMTRSFHMRVPSNTERVIIDTPAALQRFEIMELLRGADAIIIPVLSSAIDIFVSQNFIKDLLSLIRSCSPNTPVGIVANRVHKNTASFQRLCKELEDTGVPMITWLRDTPNYMLAYEMGVGIHELENRTVRMDRDQWKPLVNWLESIADPVVMPLSVEPPLTLSQA